MLDFIRQIIFEISWYDGASKSKVSSPFGRVGIHDSIVNSFLSWHLNIFLKYAVHAPTSKLGKILVGSSRNFFV